MSADRTPRTSTVRAGWSQGHPFRLITEPEERYAEFDRWLATVKADAWAEGAYAALEEEGYEFIKFDFVSETNPYRGERA
jgi:hypothetical protein